MEEALAVPEEMAVLAVPEETVALAVPEEMGVLAVPEGTAAQVVPGETADPGVIAAGEGDAASVGRGVTRPKIPDLSSASSRFAECPRWSRAAGTSRSTPWSWLAMGPVTSARDSVRQEQCRTPCEKGHPSRARKCIPLS